MDPQATLRRVLVAAFGSDEFRDALEDLATWLDSGGFPPVSQPLGVRLSRAGRPIRRRAVGFVYSGSDRRLALAEESGRLALTVSADGETRRYPFRRASR